MAPREITVLGAGSWGTALAIVLAQRFEQVHLWVHSPAVAEAMSSSRENASYLPGLTIPENVHISSTFQSSPWIFGVVPSKYLRGVLNSIAPEIQHSTRFISATKGIESGSFLCMSQLAEDCLRGRLGGAPAVLSGPTFAREIAAGEPAAIVIACRDSEFAVQIQSTIAGGNVRLYTNSDVIGVELSAALKNVIAIAAGAVEGLGLGSNSMAAVITRGLAEMGRLVVACGGEAATVSGLAGLGDLVLTCTGQLSRNRRVGVELARGRRCSDILADTAMVAEGVETTSVALQLAKRNHVDLPIAQAVQAMLDGQPALTTLRQLVDRAPKAEIRT